MAGETGRSHAENRVKFSQVAEVMALSQKTTDDWFHMSIACRRKYRYEKNGPL